MPQDRSVQNQEEQQTRRVCSCPHLREQRQAARRAVLALDVFRNSTEHEEYRAS